MTEMMNKIGLEKTQSYGKNAITYHYAEHVVINKKFIFNDRVNTFDSIANLVKDFMCSYYYHLLAIADYKKTRELYNFISSSIYVCQGEKDGDLLSITFPDFKVLVCDSGSFFKILFLKKNQESYYKYDSDITDEFLANKYYIERPILKSELKYKNVDSIISLDDLKYGLFDYFDNYNDEKDDKENFFVSKIGNTSIKVNCEIVQNDHYLNFEFSNQNPNPFDKEEKFGLKESPVFIMLLFNLMIEHGK